MSNDTPIPADQANDVSADEVAVGVAAQVSSAKVAVVTEGAATAAVQYVAAEAGIGDKQKAERKLAEATDRVVDKTNRNAELAINAVRRVKGKKPVTLPQRKK